MKFSKKFDKLKDVVVRGISKAAPVLGYAVLGYAVKKAGINTTSSVQFETGSSVPYYTWYGRASDAIVNSSMYSRDKEKALTALSPNEKIEYYEAIISIADSGMCSLDKLNAIFNQNKH